LIALGEAIAHTQHFEEVRSAWKEAESLIEKIKTEHPHGFGSNSNEWSDCHPDTRHN
jgi:hypothetical protein